MSKTYGRLQGNRGGVTRSGSRVISADLNTWERRIVVDLHDDNTVDLAVKDFHGKTIGACFGIPADRLAAMLETENGMEN